MIDTHCHLLPNVDDGPDSLVAAVELAHELEAQGVAHVVCTPHWSRLFPTTHAGAVAAGERLEDELRRVGSRLGFTVAAELSDVIAATRGIDEIRARSIGGRSVIVELVSGTLLVHAEVVVRRLANAGLTTVFAHPERCREVQHDVTQLDRLRSEGAYVQIVAPSLVDRRGGPTRDAAWELLATGRADLLGSDAHGRDDRPCELRAAEHLVTERFGPAVWKRLTLESPRRLWVDAVPGASA